MKAKDYYPTYIPRKWIHFAEHGRKYRIRKKYRNRILQTVSSHPSDFETVLFNVMQHTSRSGITTAEFCRGLTAPPLPDYFRDCSPDDGIQIPDDIRQLSEKLEELKEIIERTLSPVFDWIKELAVIPPSGYVCPVCETKQRKERLYGNETTQKRGIQNPAKYQHRTRYTPGK